MDSEVDENCRLMNSSTTYHNWDHMIYKGSLFKECSGIKLHTDVNHKAVFCIWIGHGIMSNYFSLLWVILNLQDVFSLPERNRNSFSVIKQVWGLRKWDYSKWEILELERLTAYLCENHNDHFAIYTDGQNSKTPALHRHKWTPLHRWQLCDH